MARYQSDGIENVSFVADVDLSQASGLYLFVYAASTYPNVGKATGGSNPGPVGVLQIGGSAGQAVAVKTLGHAIVAGSAGATCQLNPGDYIICGARGFAHSASAAGEADGFVFGRWLGPLITTGSAIGEAILFGGAASAVARS